MWVKGNLHCHTTVSDGDVSPDEICRTYADHGYDFLSITDHNAFVDPASVDSAGLLLIPGEELTLVPDEDHSVPLHVNGLGLPGLVSASMGYTRAQTIQNCIDAITNAGGIAQINHPNFYYAFDHKVMAETSGARLLEVYNGHPLVFNEGDDTHIGVERMWDHLLSSGRLLFGTGVDDTHHCLGEFAPERANPFRGWICARVGDLTVDEVLSALCNGDFYASSGVELADIAVDFPKLQLIIRPVDGLTYTTRFISDNGEILHETESLNPECELPDDGKRTYLRAKVIASDGTCAWTQPVGLFEG